MALSKTHQDYWLSRVSKRKDKLPDGSTYEAPDYSIRLTFENKKVRFNLNTPNQKLAAVKAKEIWIFFQANGAEATVENYKPASKKKVDGHPRTVGDFIEALRQNGMVKQQTMEIYFRKFRTLVAGAAKVPSSNKKCDYVNGGFQAWKSKVEAVPLDALTPKSIQAWISAYMRTIPIDPLSQRRAKTTINSVIRNSKNLFSKKLTEHMVFDVQSPFEGVSTFPKQRTRYHSRFDAATLANAAQNELNVEILEMAISPGERGYGKAKREREKALSKREQFKILLLSLGAGLRRDEIDTLKTSQLNFEENTITLENDADTELKSEDSAGVIDVDSATMQALKELIQPGESYVIHSKVASRLGTRYHHYRCERHFKGLLAWLKLQGIESRNAIHTMRKEFGSEVCKQFGIFVASQMLRHSNITLTREHYVDKKGRTAVSILS